MCRTRGLALAAGSLATVVSLSACGNDADGSDDTSTPIGSDTTSEGPATETASSPAETTAPSSEPEKTEESEPDDDAVTIEVTIEDGEISPLGETVEAEAGQEIELVVDSDSHDEFHVHSDPEHELAIEHGEDQRFTFSIDDPAVYEMESHEYGVVIVKLQIQ